LAKWCLLLVALDLTLGEMLRQALEEGTN
jgi:hypothetical protein